MFSLVPERIFGPSCPPRPPPTDLAFSLLINPEGGLWHSCDFWDHHVVLPNTYLAFSSRKMHTKKEQKQIMNTLSHKFE